MLCIINKPMLDYMQAGLYVDLTKVLVIVASTEVSLIWDDNFFWKFLHRPIINQYRLQSTTNIRLTFEVDLKILNS